MRKFLCILMILLMIPCIVYADLKIYFLDVDQGDSAIIVCDGEAMIIDGGVPRQSDKIYAYLDKTLHIDSLECIIATHPDNDHIGGLSAALNYVKKVKDAIYSPVKQYDSAPFNDLLKYASEKQIKIKFHTIMIQSMFCFHSCMFFQSFVNVCVLHWNRFRNEILN